MTKTKKKEQAKTETHVFQTEAKQLLHLMTHSLYSNREIFVRELVSNSSDACDKLRFEALDKDDLYEGDTELKIRIEVDSEAKTLSFTDNGIGMSKDEVMANIGTIASSGTAKFLENLTGDQQKDSALIGQFGVGFYSSFIVADKVEVFTRRAGSKATEGVYWSCSGEAEYELGKANVEKRGTKVVLHLKKDAEEFSNDWSIRSIIKKYSDHIAIPVEMEKPNYGGEEESEDGEKEKPQAPEFEAVNSIKALWTKSRSEIKDQEYKDFYKHVSNDFEEPLAWSHNRVEGKLDYTSLLYLPKKPLADLFNRETPKGLKLYVHRTFILDNAEQFLPMYLRFVKGVVDSNDLPLNVSRELLQESKEVDSIKTALTKRVLDMLGKMAKKESEKYQEFWSAFGQVMKEGSVEDSANKEKLAGLLRFSSTHTDKADQDQSLGQYIERMKEGQDKIYYIIADSFNMATKSPLLETFRSQGYEVILLTDRIDDWLMSNMHEYEGKSFQDVARGELPGLDKSKDDDKTDEEKPEDENPLIGKIKEHLSTRVSEVRASNRLVDSSACLVIGDMDMGMQMRKIMEAAGQDVPDSKPILELNMDHPLMSRVGEEKDEVFGDLVEILFDQATLAVGGQLDDPVSYVQRINKLLFNV